MKNKIKNLFKILVVTAGCLMFASFSPSLDGRAVVVDDGVFPQGLFAKTVGYLPGDIISVTNIAGDATVDLLVIGALDPSEGVAIMLSPEAAQAMGIEKGSNNIVKITKRSGQEERVYGNAVISKSATDFDDYDDGSFESIGAEENSEAFEEPAVDENMASEEFKEEETEEFTEPAPEPAPEAEDEFSEAEESFDEAIPEETEAEEETEEEAFAEEEAFDDAEEYEEYTDEAELEEETEEAFEEEPAETEEEYAEEAYEDEPLSEQPVEEEYEAFEDEELPATEEAPEEEYVEETAEPEEEAAEEDFAEEFDDEMPAEEEEDPSEEAFAADELDELPVEEEKEEVPAEEEETEETPAEESFEDEAPAEESFEEEALTEEPLAEEAFEDEKPEELPEELPEEEAFEEESPDELTETEEYEAIVLVPADSNPPEPAEDEVEDVVSEDELEELGDDTVFNLTPLEGSSAGSAGASAGAAESVVEAVAEPVETASAPVAEKTTSYDKYIVPSLNQLESGKYYIQIAVYASDENILEVINKYGNNYPITIVPMAGGSRKQVLVGPVTMDEYKVVLERFKSYGFKDAFLRKVR